MNPADDKSIADLIACLSARVLAPPRGYAACYHTACLATTISEALRDAQAGCALVIPLGNRQVIQAAVLLGARAVVVCDGQEVAAEAIREAEREGLALLATPRDVATCGRGIGAGPVPTNCRDSSPLPSGRDDVEVQATFPVLGGGYFMAGQASRRVRDMLRAAGVDDELVRRASIATYEAEMNVVIYAPSGSASVTATPAHVEVVVTDNGPGILDVEAALRPGYSTAPPKARAMGFGAGMGLPNMSRCCDELSIDGGPEGGGTRVFMRFLRRHRGRSGDLTP